MVKENYDGYRFNEKEMFCPWDVVNFIAESLDKKGSGKTIIPGNYWINSTSSNALLSYVGYLTDKATDKMQSLMDGLSIETYINDRPEPQGLHRQHCHIPDESHPLKRR